MRIRVFMQDGPRCCPKLEQPANLSLSIPATPHPGNKSHPPLTYLGTFYENRVLLGCPTLGAKRQGGGIARQDARETLSPPIWVPHSCGASALPTELALWGGASSPVSGFVRSPVPHPPPQLRRRLPMTHQTQRPQILQITLAATLRHRPDMVRIPQRPSRRHAAHPPHLQRLRSGCPAAPLQLPIRLHRIHATLRANPLIAHIHLVSQIPRI